MKKFFERNPRWELERAYWLNWCGDAKTARAIVFRVVQRVVKQEAPPSG